MGVSYHTRIDVTLAISRMIEDDITGLLRELLSQSNAHSVHIIPEDQPLPLHSLCVKLGMGCLLCATFHTREALDAPQSRAQLLEQSARAMRARIKHEGAAAWPLLSLPVDRPDPRHLILARMQQFLKGLADTSSLSQVVLTCRGTLVASAHAINEIDESRLDLLLRQLDAASESKAGSTHGELARPDVFAQSFWYAAALVGFADKPYAEDFVRHRFKQVAVELAHLLAMLDGDPDTPVKVAPAPES
jgi:hypothetical protein